MGLIVAVIGIVFIFFLIAYVLKFDPGPKAVRDISDGIKEGALAFLHREYSVEAIVVVVVAIVLAVVPGLGVVSAIIFLFGAVCSLAAGYAGMNMAIRANGRTAIAAAKSLNQGLKVSFRAGAVMGMTVVCIGLLGVTIIFLIFRNSPALTSVIPAFAMGASLVALFARAGGGIYTKGADVGSDLVGKVEKGIPEDDPRNAAVVADFVGDNVGDVAGMGADLYESYVEAIIASMVLAVIALNPTVLATALVPNQMVAWLLPLLMASGGVVASIIGILLVKVGDRPEAAALLGALRRGTLSASVLSAVFGFLIVYFLNASMGIFWAILAGLVAGVLIGEATNYFTSYAYKPTQAISRASTTGAATNIIAGFANGMLSAAPPIIFVAIAVVVAYRFADIYGVAIAGVGMLSTLGVTLATDAYGPVADNSGGIAQMAKLPPEVRERTDALDALGNTTAATGKGFAIGSAALTALALMLSYIQASGIDATRINLLDARVVAGLFLGAMMPAVFCALTLGAVGRAGALIVIEVRRQFAEIKGLWEGTAKADYSRCVDISTKAALKEMILPGVLTIIAPVIVGVLLGPYALGAFLMGATVAGFLLAIVLANSGGSWDNAKKFIESGNFGGKGSDAHKAGVIGDTVGDPFKDTSGPAINIMIKLMAIISVVFAPVLANLPGII
ncbi:MAG: sodium-translocating pyrophosphatase [Chloroflexi bacterium]|nr:sodium-translocating pyrophosphatase [Chloroflexota bacterium]